MFGRFNGAPSGEMMPANEGTQTNGTRPPAPKKTTPFCAVVLFGPTDRGWASTRRCPSSRLEKKLGKPRPPGRSPSHFPDNAPEFSPRGLALDVLGPPRGPPPFEGKWSLAPRRFSPALKPWNLGRGCFYPVSRFWGPLSSPDFLYPRVRFFFPFRCAPPANAQFWGQTRAKFFASDFPESTSNALPGFPTPPRSNPEGNWDK